MKKFLAVFTLGLLLLAHLVNALPPTPPYSLPDQSGASGKFLTTNGSVESWGAISGVYQPIDALLTAIAALTTAAGNLIYATGSDTVSVLAPGSAGTTLKMNAAGTAPAWEGITITSHGATEAAAAATMYGNVHLVTGAYTVTLPTAVSGYSAKFCSTTAAVFSIDLQATDYWILNGTTLTQANKVSSSGFAGECIEFTATAANYYRTTATSGTFIDGGA